MPKPRVVAVSAIVIMLVCCEFEYLLSCLYCLDETKEKWKKCCPNVDVVGP